MSTSQWLLSSFFHDDDMDAWYETAVDVDKAKQRVAFNNNTIEEISETPCGDDDDNDNHLGW